MLLKVIASGSGGNCIALMGSKEILLLDCGVKFKTIQREIDYRISDISGVVITHEHG